MKATKPFLFGILAAAGALSAELVLSNLYFILSGQDIGADYFTRITIFLIIVVFLEELFKYLLLLKFYLDPKSAKTLSPAIYFGLGFACVELFFTFFNLPLSQNAFYLDLGIIGIFLLHIATVGSISYLIRSEKHSPLKIITIAFLLHLTYNLMVIYDLNYLAILAYLIAIFSLLAIFSLKSKADRL